VQPPKKVSFSAELVKRQPKKKTGLWVSLAIVSVVVVIGGYVLYRKSISQKQIETETEQIRSIAVLPFRNFSESKEDEYFSDGITDDILTRLSKINDLRVTSLTSVMRYKNTDKSIPEIGKELNVAAILEGTVRRSDSRVRITAQLIDSRNDAHLWSQQYDRNLQDIFAIQSEISQAVVEELKGTVLLEERKTLEKSSTDNLEAYDLYLLGRHSYRGWGNQAEALGHYQMAIEKDHRFALAYTGLADCYNYEGLWGIKSPEDSYVKAKASALKALEIDNNLAEAHTSLAAALMFYDRNWSRAEAEYKRAIALNPRYGNAHYWYSIYLRIMKRFDEALAEIGKAQELDPMAHGSYAEEIDIHRCLGDYEKALGMYEKAQEINPVPMYPAHALIRLLVRQGIYSRDKLFRYAPQLEEYVNKTKGYLPSYYYLYAFEGDTPMAEEKLKDFLKRREAFDPSTGENYVNGTWIALIYIGLGNYDKACDWLETAYEEHDPKIIFIGDWPQYEPIRSDPRFKALLEKMRLGK